MKRYTLLVLIMALVSSCHTQKHIQRDVAAATDSVGTSAHHRTFSTTDSILQNLTFDFDTLTITVERPALFTEGLPTRSTEIVRLKAVRGQIKNTKQEHRAAVEVKTQLDSTALKVRSADKSAEHTSTTVAYEPPRSAHVLIFVFALLLIIALITYFFLRKKVFH